MYRTIAFPLGFFLAKLCTCFAHNATYSQTVVRDWGVLHLLQLMQPAAPEIWQIQFFQTPHTETILQPHLMLTQITSLEDIHGKHPWDCSLCAQWCLGGPGLFCLFSKKNLSFLLQGSSMCLAACTCVSVFWMICWQRKPKHCEMNRIIMGLNESVYSVKHLYIHTYIYKNN